MCWVQVNMLMERNPRFGNKISFVDIADDNYDPETCAGITFAEAMEEIHAILPDGRIITGIEVFRCAPTPPAVMRQMYVCLSLELTEGANDLWLPTQAPIRGSRPRMDLRCYTV